MCGKCILYKLNLMQNIMKLIFIARPLLIVTFQMSIVFSSRFEKHNVVPLLLKKCFVFTKSNLHLFEKNAFVDSCGNRNLHSNRNPYIE